MVAKNGTLWHKVFVSLFLSGDTNLHEVAPNRIRRDIHDLSERDVMSLKAALLDLQRDHGPTGWEVSAVRSVSSRLLRLFRSLCLYLSL